MIQGYIISNLYILSYMNQVPILYRLLNDINDNQSFNVRVPIN